MMRKVLSLTDLNRLLVMHAQRRVRPKYKGKNDRGSEISWLGFCWWRTLMVMFKIYISAYFREYQKRCFLCVWVWAFLCASYSNLIEKFHTFLYKYSFILYNNICYKNYASSLSSLLCVCVCVKKSFTFICMRSSFTLICMHAKFPCWHKTYLCYYVIDVRYISITLSCLKGCIDKLL